MRLSLRYRLLLPLALLLVGDAAATAWAASRAARHAERQLAEQQWAIVRTLDKPHSTFPLTEAVLEQMRGFSGAHFTFVPAGELPRETVSTFPKPQPPPPSAVPRAPHTTSEADPQLGPSVVVAGAEYRCLRVALGTQTPAPPRRGDLYIFYPESLRRSAVDDAVQPLLVLGGAGVFAVVLAFAFGSRLVRRVRALDARTKRIASGDFRPIPSAGPNDELRDLGAAVNEMARRLAAFQEELQHSERLRVLGQFSGGLAHQLRNAAAGAKLAVELFLAENPGADPEPLQVALRQLARIESNLRQFLALGKPPPGERKLCDLGELIGQAVSLLKPQSQHAGTVVEWSAPAERVVVTGDPTQLSHLFGNVIGNAVEAAGPGGRVRVHLAPSGGRARVEVEDTGPGPPATIAEKLFDPFVTGKNQGIGLGLAVAKQAVDAHGGSIAWKRKEGRTVFTIHIPNNAKL